MGILSDRQIRNEIGITPFKDYGPKVPGTISSGLGSYGYDVRLGYKFKVFSPIHAKEIDPKNFDPACLVDVDLSPTYNHIWVARYQDMNSSKIGWQCTWCGQSKETHIKLEPEVKGETCSVEGENPQLRTKCDHILIPPHSFVLAESLERFKIPRDVLCVVVGKSTYARCGLIVNVTPGEPEWEGVWTIEISNTTPLPVRVYPGEGIMQCLFYRSDDADRGCERSYADKAGKYQGQNGLTLPKSEGA